MRCKIGYNAMFTARIAYSADFFQSQVPRTKRYLLYLPKKFRISNIPHEKFTYAGVFTYHKSSNLR